MGKNTATRATESAASDAPQPTRRELRSRRQAAAVDAAFQLAGEEGAAGLTMRRLAQTLDLDVAALYRLFRDKDELLLALCERTIELALDEIGEVTAAESWQDTVRRIAEATWQIQTRYPGITALTFARTTGGPAERRMVELLLAAFTRSGLDPERAALFYRTFVDTALGLCAHAAALSALNPEARAKDDTTWTRVYARLPESDYPETRAHADALSAVHQKAVYDTAVEAILVAAARAATG
ncbi:MULTISPECIES: TetR/AcrR family transcriptional regulator [unclassified Streptomyces]|uniref:TetR/AcrR family transcriptional regulator n=1 Tax=unclassified Streptomyces TaxID=2593676 RepID=UPI0035E1BA89